MFLEKSSKLAIVDFDGTNIDYNQLVANVKNYSYNVFNKIKKDDKVLIISENRKEWVYSLFGIWDKLATVVAVDALSTAEEIKYFIDDCNPSAIVVSNNNYELVKSITDLPIYNLDMIENIEISDEYVLKHPEGEEIAVMIYTSGTTGNPKAVMLSMNNIINEIDAIKSLNVTMEDDQVLGILPLHHILPLMTTCLYFYYYKNKYSVVFVSKLNSQEILKALSENRVTLMSAVPRLYKMFYKGIKDKINSSFITRNIYKLAKFVNNKKFSKLIFSKVHKTFGGHMRSFIAGGAKSDVEMIEFFNVIGINYLEGYGLSETAPVIAGNRPNEIKAGTVGRKVDNAEIRLVNGELWVKGPMVMKGYYNKPDKTNEVITEDGWFRTGDLAEIDDEGYITILGRANAMIVLSNGKNIDPEKLENKILSLSEDIVEEIGIFGKNDKLHAIIVPKKNIANISTHIKDLVQTYNTQVHNYEKILNYRIINEELPKTRVGKIRRFMLANLFETKEENKKIENEPKDIYYTALKEYVKKLKGVEVAPDENIEIDLGLDSLDIVELISYIENSFNVKLNEEIIANNPNLRLLSKYISEKSTGYIDNEIGMEDIVKNAKEIKTQKSGLLHYLARILIYIVFKLYFRIEIKGKNRIISDEPVIFIANHQSFLDAPSLQLLLPTKVYQNTYFLALAKYFSNKIMSFIANRSNIVKISLEKDIKQSIETIAGVLKAGKNVFIFPEGSRTKDGDLDEFKKVYAIISKTLNVKVQCLGIKGAYRAWSRFDKFPKPYKIEVKELGIIDPRNKTVDDIIEESYKIYRNEDLK